ncbi:MAG: protoporphyrinogen oxidase [Desulfurivibrio sp.]|nr:protoporphyrinogen oxidase [Desulfurivibrio sp.]
MTQDNELIIIGAGLSGLALAHFLGRENDTLQVTLLEAGSRPGGVIRSFAAAGFQAEWGPHGFLDNNPASRQLLAATGLEQEVVKAPLKQNVRYLCQQGRLVPLPQSPRALLTTPLLSWRGKLRLAGELFKKPLADGHSIGHWAAHRFGPEVLPLVDAALTGTYAGDYQRLSIDAVMPGARRLEKEHGSLLRGLLKEGWQKKAQKRQQASTAASSDAPEGGGLPAMTSFRGGMEQLVSRLARDLNIVYDCPVEQIRPTASGWQLNCGERRFNTRQLVLALPVNQALQLLTDFNPPLSAIPEARITTVALGFRAQDAQVPAGFGYLAPEREKRFTLGALFSSRMFPERAPAGHHLLEALVGGRRHPERLELSDEELLKQIYDDLKELLPISAPPVFSRVLRAGGGIPQLEEHHLELLRWREQLQNRQPGLQLIGFGWDGIGINDMIKAAQQCAQRLKAAGGANEQAQLRPVYF